jgi:hypothetical protein
MTRESGFSPLGEEMAIPIQLACGKSNINAQISTQGVYWKYTFCGAFVNHFRGHVMHMYYKFLSKLID